MTINGKTITIADIMRPAVTIEQSATLEQVLTRMVAEKRNSLSVVDENGVFVGAVNAVDVIKEVLPDYLEDDVIAARFADDALLKEDAQRVKDKPVSEFMAKDVPGISADTSLLEAAVLAVKQGRGRITIVDDNKHPVGILTRTEIKRVIAAYLDIEGALIT